MALPRGLSRRTKVAIIVGACLVLIAAGLVVRRRDHLSSGVDPRLAGIMREVEVLRGLKFTSAVTVSFLSVADYDRLSPPPQGLSESQLAEERILGIADWAGQQAERARPPRPSESTLASYNWTTKRIMVPQQPDGAFSARLRVTLAHELTHALQDQHFPAVFTPINASTDDGIVTLAIVEGDARRIERAYRTQRLTELERERVREGSTITFDRSSYSRLRSVRYDRTWFPFDVADHYMSLVTEGAADPNRVADRVLRSPPTTTGALMFPAPFDDPGPGSIADPMAEDADLEAAGGATVRYDRYGAFVWMQVLATTTGYVGASDAVMGIVDDTVRLSQQGGRTCLAAKVRFRDRPAALRFAALIRTTPMAQGLRLSSSGSVLVLRRCDPDRGVRITARRRPTATSALRWRMVWPFEKGTAWPASQGWCIAGKVLERLGEDQTVSASEAGRSERVIAPLAKGLAPSCSPRPVNDG